MKELSRIEAAVAGGNAAKQSSELEKCIAALESLVTRTYDARDRLARCNDRLGFNEPSAPAGTPEQKPSGFIFVIHDLIREGHMAIDLLDKQVEILGRVA